MNSPVVGQEMKGEIETWRNRKISWCNMQDISEGLNIQLGNRLDEERYGIKIERRLWKLKVISGRALQMLYTSLCRQSIANYRVIKR